MLWYGLTADLSTTCFLILLNDLTILLHNHNTRIFNANTCMHAIIAFSGLPSFRLLIFDSKVALYVSQQVVRVHRLALICFFDCHMLHNKITLRGIYIKRTVMRDQY